MAVSQVQSGFGPAGLPCERIRLCLCRAQRCTLQDLPLDIVVQIIAMAAPEVWQQASCRHWEGRGRPGARNGARTAYGGRAGMSLGSRRQDCYKLCSC